MKKQFFKSFAVKAYSTVLLTSVLLFSSVNPANATEKGDTTQKMQITYLGAANNLMSFNVNYANTGAEKFILRLIDEDGAILYQKKFTDKGIDKNIYLKNLNEKSTVSFVILAGKNVYNQTFDINTKTRIVEDMEVTKL